MRLTRNAAGVFDGAQVSSVGIYADNLNILMSTPESQIYLQRLGGQFENTPPLLPGQTFNLNGNAAVSLGPGFEVDFPDWLGGSKKGQGIYALRLDGGITLKIPEGFDVNASLSILGFTIGQNRTYLNIANAVRRWGTVLESQSRVTLPFDIVVLTGLFNIDARLNFQIKGTAETRWPVFIPFVGGRTIASSGAMMKYAAPSIPNPYFRGEYGFVASWIPWPVFLPPYSDRVGTRVRFDGKFDVILGKDIDGFSGLGTVDSLEEFSQLATSDTLLAAYEQQHAGDPLPSRTFDVSQERKWAAISVRWLAKNNIENPSSLFEVVAPDGTVYRDFTVDTEVKLIEEMSDAQGISLGIVNPEAGTWTVRQVTGVDLGPVQIKMYENSIAPVGTIEQVVPDANGQWVDITYSVADADSSRVKVDLYMDTDGKGQNGTLLTTLEVDPSAGTETYRWLTEDLPKGEYSFYIVVDDIEHVPTVRYFDGGINALVNTPPARPLGSFDIGQGNDLPVVSDLEANWLGNGAFLVTWSDTERPQYYNIRWSDNPAGSTDNAIGTDYSGVQPTPGLGTLYKEEGGRFYHKLVIDGLTEGELYRFQIQSIDSQDRLGATGETALAVAGIYDAAIAVSHPDEWNYVAVVGQPYTAVITQDTVNETKTVTPLVLPAGASYDAQTHQLTWQPTLEQLGEHLLQFKVENQFGDSYLETQRLQVLEYSLEDYQTLKLPEENPIYRSKQTIPIHISPSITYSNNDDTITLNDNGYAIVNAQGGNDTLTVGAYAHGDGGAGDDILTAVAGILPGGVYLDGGEGNDILSGSNDNDTLLGGSGNDVIVWSPGVDTIDGGTGTDTLAGIQDLDLTQEDSASITQVEVFQVAEGGTLILNQAAILAIASEGNILEIQGENGTIYLADEWQYQGPMVAGDGGFLRYKAGDVTLAIANTNSIAFLTGDVGTSLGQFNLDEFGDTLKTVATFTPSPQPDANYSIFPEGFKVSLTVEPGDSSTLMINLSPEYQHINTVLRQDPVTGDWAEFLFDGQVGAELFDQDNDGKIDQILLHLQDGSSTDPDGVADGEINFTGLLGTTTPGLATPVSGSRFLNGFGQPIPLTVRAVSLPENGNFEFGFLKTDYDDFRGLPGAYEPTDEGWSAFVPLETQAAVFRNGERRFFDLALEANPADSLALNRTIAQNIITAGGSLAPTEHRAVGTLPQVTIEDAYSLTPYILDLNTNQMFSAQENTLEVITDGRGFAQISAETSEGTYAVEILTLPLLTPGIDGGETVATLHRYRASAYRNTLGLYRLADAQGGIDITGDGLADFRPGEDGYAEAAIAMASRNDPLTGGVLFDAPTNFGDESTTTLLQAGALYGLFLITNGTAEQFLQQNPGNQPGGVNAFFMYAQANPDNEHHFMRLGQSLFGVEDLLGGGRSRF